MNLLEQLFINPLQKYRYRAQEAEKGSAPRGLSSRRQFMGLDEKPSKKPKDILKVIDKDPTADFVVTSTVNSSIGLGFHYKSDGSTEGEEQIRLLEEFNNDVNVMMRGRNVEIGRYMLGVGFAPVELVSTELLSKINPLPLDMDWSFVRERRGGEITSYIQQDMADKVEFKAEELVPFLYRENADHPLGRGLAVMLLETQAYTLKWSDNDTQDKKRPSLFRSMTMITHDLVNLIHHGVPKTLWNIGVRDDKLDGVSDRVEKMDAGERIVTNAKNSGISQESTDVKSGFSQVVGDFNDIYATALMSFLPKFFSKNPWTESSSITAERTWYNAIVQQFRDRFREQKVRRIDDLILRQNGFDENKTKLVWSMPQAPRLDANLIISLIGQTVTAFQAGMIDGEYARTVYTELIDTLGQVGIGVSVSNPSSPNSIASKATELSEAIQKGELNFDQKHLRDKYENDLSEHKSTLKDNVQPHRIKRMIGQ